MKERGLIGRPLLRAISLHLTGNLRDSHSRKQHTTAPSSTPDNPYVTHATYLGECTYSNSLLQYPQLQSSVSAPLPLGLSAPSSPHRPPTSCNAKTNRHGPHRARDAYKNLLRVTAASLAFAACSSYVARWLSALRWAASYRFVSRSSSPLVPLSSSVIEPSSAF